MRLCQNTAIRNLRCLFFPIDNAESKKRGTSFMELIIVFVVLAVLYFYFSSKGKSKGKGKATKEQFRSKTSNDLEEIKKSFLPPMPSGYQIYAGGFPVAGMQHRKEEAIRFAKSDNQELSLQKDPANEFDKNAIKLIGHSGSN